MIRKKLIGLTMIILFSLIVIALWYAAPRSPLWPQDNLSIGLPYSEEFPPSGMEPMGETINHPKPQVPYGHPGIDFQWRQKVPIIAAADGTVDKIAPGQSGGVETINVWIRNGKFTLRYEELESLADGIEKDSQISKGEFIGYPHAPLINGEVTEHRQVHWSFGYSLRILEPLCPMTYFDRSAFERINTDWQNAAYAHRDKFSEICSGDFAGRDSLF